jgi:hypothetical protein
MLKLVLPLLLASASAYAETPAAIYGAANCRIGTLLPEPVDRDGTWSGACKDGFADGPGVLAWNDAGDSKRRIEGTLVKGVVTGAAKLTYAPSQDERYWGQGRNSYEGTLRDGRPDGRGFLQYADGTMYEGDVVAGKPHGAGIYQDIDRSRYEGQWVDGQREGRGKMTFTVGGSYDGEWKDGGFDGVGTIVYSGTPRTWHGNFAKGRRVDDAKLPDGDVEGYNVPGNFPQEGSRIRPMISIVAVPPAASWEQLSVAERNVVKARSGLLLAPGDEPPYPVKGAQAMSRLVSEIRGQYEFAGNASVYVTIGSDGKPTSARMIGKVPAEMGRLLSAAAMRLAYKPAMCDGTPCEMIYPYKYKMIYQ